MSAPKRRSSWRFGPTHEADGDRHVVLGKVGQPALLVVLKTISGALDLDQVVAPFGGPELDQVGKTRAVAGDVGQQAQKPFFEVAGRYAAQRLLKQLGTQCRPMHERA